ILNCQPGVMALAVSGTKYLPSSGTEHPLPQPPAQVKPVATPNMMTKAAQKTTSRSLNLLDDFMDADPYCFLLRCVPPVVQFQYITGVFNGDLNKSRILKDGILAKIRRLRARRPRY